MSENRESITITSTEEAQVSEAEVQEQPVVPDAPAEAQAPQSEAPVDLNLQVEDTPKKTVDEFFEQDYERIMQAVVDNGGQFTEELYAEFEANGHSRAIADRLLEAEVAKATLRTQQVVNAVGGQETAQRALEWAAANLTDAQKAAVNKQLGSVDSEVAKMALQSLIAQSGANTSMVSGDTGMVAGAGYFENEADFHDALRDNTRMSDATYRNNVMAKLQRSIEMGLINPSTR